MMKAVHQGGGTFREDSWQRGPLDVESGLQRNQRTLLLCSYICS
jgi:hypothetical protein